MKKGKYVLATAFSLLCFCSINAQNTAQFTERKNQLGIRISSKAPVINNSISYRRFLNSTLGLEGLFSISDPVGIGALVEKFQPIGDNGLSWFWGVGPYVGFSGGRTFGAQGIVGVDVVFPSAPVNLSLDWKPELNIIKQFSFESAALGLSARFVF